MNKILDYEQVLSKITKLVNNKSLKNKIREQKPIGITTYGLPINHYIIGNGKNHIVISGAFHGCEIISTDFVVQAMEKIAFGQLPFDFKSCTLHFIPMVNPEGYLISTSAIRKLIPREMSSKEAEVICKEYYNAFRQDDINASKGEFFNFKLHQQIFDKIDYNCISNKYFGLKQSIKALYENYPIPLGTLQSWSSNGNGIDLNQNSPFNFKIKEIKNGKICYNNMRYNNIFSTIPRTNRMSY